MKYIRSFSEKNKIIGFFDPQSTPKTKEQIDSFASELLSNVSKQLRTATVSCITIIICFCLCTALSLPSAREFYGNNESLIFLSFFSSIALLLFFLYQGSKVTKLLRDNHFIGIYTGKISDSYHVSERPDGILKISTMFSNPTLKKYLESVSAQGREIIEAELKVLFDFYSKTDEYLQEQNLAKELLFIGDVKNEG